MTEEKKDVRQIEQDIFTPAFREAMQKAAAGGYPFSDAVFAAANAYHNMIVNLIGKEEALTLLEKQISFLRSEIEK